MRAPRRPRPLPLPRRRRRRFRRRRRCRGGSPKKRESSSPSFPLQTPSQFRCGDQFRCAAFAAVFKELLHALYEADVVDEEALLAWADEKAAADASERRFLERAMPLIQWLREASSEEDEDGEDDEEDGEEEE